MPSADSSILSFHVPTVGVVAAAVAVDVIAAARAVVATTALAAASRAGPHRERTSGSFRTKMWAQAFRLCRHRRRWSPFRAPPPPPPPPQPPNTRTKTSVLAKQPLRPELRAIVLGPEKAVRRPRGKARREVTLEGLAQLRYDGLR